MNLLERVLTLLRANLNSVVENTDDPERSLRQLQLDMRNQLVQVKTEIARAIAQSHTLQKRAQLPQSDADKWLQKAESAVRQGNDKAAREALTRYNEQDKQVERYRRLQQEQDQLVSTLRNALRQLEAKIAEIDTTVELLVTRKRNALIQQKVLQALNKTSDPVEQERTRKAQDTVLAAEARARALADLEQRGFDRQLQHLTEEQQVESQLQRIKARNRPTAKRLPPSNKHEVQTGPLTYSTTQEALASTSLDNDQEMLITEMLLPVEEADSDDLEYVDNILDTTHDKDHS
jgi:phage shock protein A